MFRNLLGAAFFLAGCGTVQEDVAWHATDGTEIHGRLHLPQDARSGDARFPLVVFVDGSGRGPALDVSVVRAHANELTRRGFAVLTYDKRGAGVSGGDFPASFELMAGDLISGVDAIGRDRRIDPNRVSVIALSQGWWVSTIAIERGLRPRSLIGIGAPSVSPIVQQEHVMASEMRARGASENDVAEGMVLLGHWADVMRGRLSRAQYGELLAQAERTTWFAPVAEQMALWPEGDAYGAWYQSIMDHDPMPALRRSTTPTTVFQGERDQIVSPARSAADYGALRAEGVPIDFHLISGGAHDLSSRVWIFPRTWPNAYWDDVERAIRESWRAAN